MILQALKEFYDRKFAEGKLPPFGFEIREIPFIIVIDEHGKFISLEDTRELDAGNRLVGKKFLVPIAKNRTSGITYETANLMWDNIGYVLGIPSDDDPESIFLANKKHDAWIESLNRLPPNIRESSEVKAVIKFYENGGKEKVLDSEEIEECKKIPGCNIAFRLNTEHQPIPSGEMVKKHQESQMNLPLENEEVVIGTDLVTSLPGQIVRLHRKTRIYRGGDSLVSFQVNSGYDSYGKEQGYNAPISKDTEFAYTTALNYLLKSENQQMIIGDSHVVFWGSKDNSLEKKFYMLFNDPDSRDLDANVSQVKELFNSIKSGAYIRDEGKIPFYVLGLSSSARRIFVRFWERGIVSEYAERIKQYFDDFSIVGNQNEIEYYPLKSILTNISTLNKTENIPPSLAGDVMSAILKGTTYPAMMLQLALRRIRSDVKHRVTRVRAATVKAYLNRYNKLCSDDKIKEITMKLDTTHPSAGYQLGRLFAALERIQEKANPGLNATIRDRYYGSACTSPVSVFPTLLRLKNHHLAKIENRGMVTWFEKKLGEIMDHVEFFPSHLDLHSQGMFAVGYYHQRQDFFTKKEESEEE